MVKLNYILVHFLVCLSIMNIVIRRLIILAEQKYTVLKKDCISVEIPLTGHFKALQTDP